jgi:hypothetical protein
MPEISARMDRTRSAIKNRIHKVGIQRTRGIPWSAAEDATIRRLFANNTNNAVASRIPGRTGFAIWARAKRLGLKKSAEHLAP